MSYVSGNTSEDPRIHFETGIKDFARLDKVRFINIMGSIQYGIFYSVIYFLAGLLLHVIFPPFTKEIALTTLAGWILLQCLALIIVVFYVRKFVEVIPGLLSFFPTLFNVSDLKKKGWIPYGIDEFHGDITTSLVLIGTQYRLLEKVAYLTKEVARLYF